MGLIAPAKAHCHIVEYLKLTVKSCRGRNVQAAGIPFAPERAGGLAGLANQLQGSMPAHRLHLLR